MVMAPSTREMDLSVVKVKRKSRWDVLPEAVKESPSHQLSKVLATLPVSTAEVERSFSSLKRIKSYLRNSMSNERLNGLALLSIHYPAPINSDEVIDEMVRSGNRRLVL